MEAILFTDIADSTGFKARAGPAAYSRDLRRHNTLFEQCIRDSAGGAVIKHTGDGFFAHFADASDAVLCALRFQRALAAEAWHDEAIRVRIGVHIGEVEPLRMANRTDLVGSAVDEAARIMSLAAGGQILLSGDAADSARLLIRDNSLRWKRHGLYKLKGVSLPIEIWQVADAALGLLLDPPGSLDAAIPNEIGPYRILEQLGEGGMGTVYKAEQRRPVKRIVALKVIKLGLGSAEVIARFESERQALARMDHPSIAKVLDAGQTGAGQPYFAMEYVPGVPITKFADDKKLSLQQRLELFRDVCAAIAHAHTKAIIHRDIKSSNVLAYLSDEKPFVKVIDFGIAKALTGDRLTDQTFNTDRGRAIGTFDSMSPEQAEGSPDIDTRTDVYSLGVLLYELLTGAPPFDRETLAKAADQEIRRIIREVEPPRPSDRLSSLGEAGTKIAASRREKLGGLERELRTELEWIPLMAMRKDRDRRYANPLEFSADIENYLEGRPLHAGPESVGYRLRKFLHRNRGKVAAATAIVILLVGGIIGTSLGFVGQRRLRVQADQAAAVAEHARQLEEAAKERAIGSAKEARDAQARADQSAFDARLRLAEWLESQGDALAGIGRWFEAKKAYKDAYADLVDLKVSPFKALVAISMANVASPPALLTFTGHSGLVYGVAIAPNGRIGLTGSNDNTLRVWDLITGREIRVLTGHDGRVYSVAISHDGRTALSGSEDNSLKLWNLETGKEIRTFTGHTDAVYSVAISPDGRTALSGSEDNSLKLWNLDTGREIRTFTGHKMGVTGVAFTPDGRLVISGSLDGTVKLWDLASGKEIRTFIGHTGGVYSVAISPDGLTALSGGADETLKLWDLGSGREIRTLMGHTGYVSHVAISPDGHTALSGSLDQTVKLWDLATGKQIRTYTQPSDVLGVLFAPNGVNSAFPSVSAAANAAYPVAFSPDGRLALSGDFDHTAKLWDLTDAKDVHTLASHTDVVFSVAISPDGRTALSGSFDKTLKLWDLATGKVIRTFAGPYGAVAAVAFNPDGRTALSGCDKQMCLWDIATGTVVRTFPGQGRFMSVAISPDGHSALASIIDFASPLNDTVKLWNLNTGEAIRPLVEDGILPMFAMSVAISPDGHAALSNSSGTRLKLWDLATGKAIRTFTGHALGIWGVAFSPDGRTALSGSFDKTLKLWDLTTGKEIKTLAGHTAYVTSAAFSRDGRFAVSGSADKTIKLWDLGAGKEIRTLTGHTNTVYSVAFSPDGRSVLSGSADGTLEYWDFSRVDVYSDFDARVQRAQTALDTNPDDATAMAVLGDWYAFRRINNWAVELLEKARAGGADVSSLTLARCYWNLNKLPEAKREFQNALESNEAPADYLNLCIDALGNSIPATQPH